MKSLFSFIVVIIILQALIGCGPARIEQFEQIGPSETAFVIPLEGSSEGGQMRFQSVDFLEEHKVATKRISLPLRQVSTGRAWWAYQYIPTVAVLKVNRAPVTREWTDTGSGTKSNSNEAVEVESRESIGFKVGVVATAFVREEDASLYFYNYGEKPLSDIMDQNVRGACTSILSQEFGIRSLSDCQAGKREIFELMRQEVVPQYAATGITITNVGLSEGFTYTNTDVQDRIDAKFTSLANIEVAHNNKLAQDEKNKQDIAVAAAQAQAARELMAAEEAMQFKNDLDIRIMLAEAKKLWNGQLPANILPENSPLLLELGCSTAP